jgi:hypothetical protein
MGADQIKLVELSCVSVISRSGLLGILFESVCCRYATEVRLQRRNGRLQAARRAGCPPWQSFRLRDSGTGRTVSDFAVADDSNWAGRSLLGVVRCIMKNHKQVAFRRLTLANHSIAVCFSTCVVERGD